MATPVGLVRLRKAAEAAGARFGVAAQDAFLPCGLGLVEPGEAYAYWCTPANVRTFATTGGDGTHYSHLVVPQGGDTWPIVMTCPMAGSTAAECNAVVAESFEEFFSLGYYVGWFSLEQLVHEGMQALPYFGAPDAEQADWCAPRLEFAREALRIVARPPTAARLAELANKYSSLLKYTAQSAA